MGRRRITEDPVPKPDRGTPYARVGRFKTIKTHAIHLVDGQGNLHGGLGFTDAYEPAIMLLDPAGTVRAQLLIQSKGNPAFYLADGTGKPRVQIRVGPDGTVGLRIDDTAGRPRVMIGLEADSDVPKMGVIDEDESELWGFPMKHGINVEALGADLEDFARRGDREGFRLLWRRSGFPLVDLDMAWTQAVASVQEVDAAAKADGGTPA